METVITPRDGCKLVVRNSKGVGQEDYYVDAIEVISFGHALFFRSIEKPKSFLVPVSDYEVIEVKETRMVLKNASIEKTIKIGGGKESVKPETPKVETEETSALKKRDKRRSRRRRSSLAEENRAPLPQSESEGQEEVSAPENPEQNVETLQAPPKPIRAFIPPPSYLIKEKLDRYKMEEGAAGEPSSPDEVVITSMTIQPIKDEADKEENQ